jgi:hypothetical protein
MNRTDIPISNRDLVFVSSAVLVTVFLLMVVQKQFRYGGSPEYDVGLSLLFTFIMVVPFIVCIRAGLGLDRFVRARSLPVRIALAVIGGVLMIAAYGSAVNGLLWGLGLSSDFPSPRFLMKYISGAVFVHAALYLFVQIVSLMFVRRAKSPIRQVADRRADGVAETAEVVGVTEVAGIPVGSIRRIESCDHYVRIHSVEEVTLVRTTMRELENSLPAPFLRVHRSHIVNFDHVDGCVREGRAMFVRVGAGRVRVSASAKKRVNARLRHGIHVASSTTERTRRR